MGNGLPHVGRPVRQARECVHRTPGSHWWRQSWLDRGSRSYEAFLAHPKCGFVFGHGRLIDPAGCEMLPNFLPVIPDAGDYEQLLEHNPIAFPAVVMSPAQLPHIAA